MLQYPFFNLSGTFIFSLFALYSIWTKTPVNFLRLVLFVVGTFCFIKPSKKTLTSILLLLITLAVYANFHLRSCKHLDDAKNVRGTFQWDKIFRTKATRIGGLGTLRFNDGKTIPIYLHGRQKVEQEYSPYMTYYIRGKLLPLKPPFCSSSNFTYYLWARGIRHHMYSPKIYPRPKLWKPTLLQKCRERFQKHLEAHFKNLDCAHTHSAILLGRKEFLQDPQMQNFFNTGTMHLFAVSGLHVGIVSTFFFFLGRLFSPQRWVRLLVTFIGVSFYALLVGLSPSTLRATLMVYAILAMQQLNRPIDIKAAFTLTLFTALMINPWQIWDVGFQLSYGVVASLIYIGGPFCTYMKGKKHLGKWQSALYVSLSASLMSTLLTAYYWGILTPWAFVANLFLIPYTSIIVILGMISGLLGFIYEPILAILNPITELTVWLLLKAVSILSQLPGSVFKLQCSTNALLLGLGTLLLFSLYLDKKLRLQQSASKDKP